MSPHILTELVVCLAAVVASPTTAVEPVYRQPTPEANPPADQEIPSDYRFGASSTRKAPQGRAAWHEYSRTDEFADIMVRFGNGDEQLVFGRATSCLPVRHFAERRVRFPTTGCGRVDRRRPAVDTMRW